MALEDETCISKLKIRNCFGFIFYLLILDHSFNVKMFAENGELFSVASKGIKKIHKTNSISLFFKRKTNFPSIATSNQTAGEYKMCKL